MKAHTKIKFVGKKLGLKPLKAFTDGTRRIVLPENQSRAFSHPDARAILQHSPEAYKPVVPKAKK
jgi:hypothetical protein